MRGALRYFLIASLLLGGLLCGSLTGLSLAGPAHRSVGTLPPRNPAADCGGVSPDLAAIDRCRAQEGVGPLRLPSNWTALSTDDQLLVLVDLERVNRGLPVIPALVKPLNALAQAGARRGDDPAFPAGGFTWVGSIWASADPPSVLEADELWMYDDAGSDWGHRDNILKSGALIGGAGATRDNWTFEMLAGGHYPASAVTFTWAQELRHFAHRPGLEPLAR